MNSSVDPRKLTPAQYAKGINVSLSDEVVGTRFAIKIHPLRGDVFPDLNIQGACYYNPSRGIAASSFGPNFSSIAVSAGGRTFLILPSEDFRVSEITGGIKRNSEYPICSMIQAENYLIVSQPTDNTLIFDGQGETRWSNGINDSDRDNSELANTANAAIYAHGRIHQVVAGRKIFVSDIIHQTEGSNAENILKTTDQVYWATGGWFAPPSDWDAVVAAAILPTQNTAHGHGEVMFHSPSGIMSLRSNVFPRSSWADTEMIRHAVLGSGAMGPYAVLPISSGDQIFRSLHGLQSLRSVASQGQSLGGPVRSLAEEVDIWMAHDYVPFLKYASLAKLDRERKIFCTTSPVMNGSKWWHRGILSLHLLPDPTSDIRPSWEGMITFPPAGKYPVIMVDGDFDGIQRLFVLCYDSDGKVALAEILSETGNDMIGCTPSRIPCSVVTGQFTAGSPLTNKSFNSVTPIFSDVRGSLDWKIRVRTDRYPNWVDLTSDSKICAIAFDATKPLAAFHPASINETYSIPDELVKAKWIQVQVSWMGVATLDGVRVDFDTFDPSLDQSEFSDKCYIEEVTTCDGDFSYLEEISKTVPFKSLPAPDRIEVRRGPAGEKGDTGPAGLDGPAGNGFPDGVTCRRVGNYIEWDFNGSIYHYRLLGGAAPS